MQMQTVSIQTPSSSPLSQHISARIRFNVDDSGWSIMVSSLPHARVHSSSNSPSRNRNLRLIPLLIPQWKRASFSWSRFKDRA